MKRKTVFRDLSGSRLLKSNDKFEHIGGVSFLNKWTENHRKFGEGKFTELIRSIRPTCCRRCGSKNIKLVQAKGVSLPRWLCIDEGITFNVLDGTIFDSSKLPFDEWIEYLMAISGMASFGTAAITGKHSWKTIKYWTKKAFIILKDYQKNIVLDGTIWMDETAIALSSQFQKRDSAGRRMRGNSKNNLNIVVASNGKSAVAFVVSLGMADENQIYDALEPHIVPGSTICHDGSTSHGKLVRELQLKSEIHPTYETRGLSAKDDPLEKINHLHFLLKQLLKSHGRFRRDELQGYLDLFTFWMNPPGDRWTKACKLIAMGLNTQVVQRYRNYYKKNSEEDDHAVPDKFKAEYHSWMKM